MAEGNGSGNGKGKNGGGVLALSSTGMGVGGLALGMISADSEAAKTLLAALLSLIGKLDPNVVLIGVMFFATGAACWLRTTQIANHIAKQYDAIQLMQRTLAVLMDRRSEQRQVSNDRRNLAVSELPEG